MTHHTPPGGGRADRAPESLPLDFTGELPLIDAPLAPDPDGSTLVLRDGVPKDGLIVFLLRRQARSITVSPTRVVLRHGSAAQTCERAATDSVVAGPRYARFRNALNQHLLWVPLTRHRDEILAMLRRHEWPLADDR